jgi:hypothetical protein
MPKLTNLSIEEVNARWITAFKELAWKRSDTPTQGYLLVTKEEEVGFDLAGKMSLPYWSRPMVDKMALFCRSDMIIESPPQGMSSFPATYWAHSLLYASYPRHGGVFKGHNGASHVLCLSSLENLGDDEITYCMFQGLGTILMESVRMIMSPFDDDEAILAKSKDWYICIEG